MLLIKQCLRRYMCCAVLIIPLINNWGTALLLIQKQKQLFFRGIKMFVLRFTVLTKGFMSRERTTLNAWKVIVLATSYEALSQPGLTFVNFPCMSKLSSIVFIAVAGSLYTVAIGYNCTAQLRSPIVPWEYRMKRSISVFAKVPMVREDICHTIHGCVTLLRYLHAGVYLPGHLFGNNSLAILLHSNHILHFISL